jgi:hypothetical protein
MMKMLFKGKSVALTAAVLASLSLVGVADAGPNNPAGSGATAKAPSILKATGGSLTNINLTVDACNGVSGTLTVTATGATDDGGGLDVIWFTIFDDSAQKFARSISIPVGSTVATPIAVSYPGQIGTSAPGIGLELGESQGDGSLANIDPFFPTQVGGCSTGALSVPTQSPWSLGGVSALLAMLGLGALFARRRAR